MTLLQSQTSRHLSWHATALVVMLAVGAWVRFHDIGGPSLWMDEIWSIEIASGRDHAHDQLPTGILMTRQRDLTSLAGSPPWWRVWSARSDYTYPPLYPLLLRWWMDLFGNGAAAVRSLSAVFGLAAIAVMFDVCRWLHGRRTAFLAAGMMALAVAQVDVAQEARSYALLILLALGCCDLVVRIQALGPAPRRLVLLAIFTSATFLTHYLSLGVLAVLVLYALVKLRGSQRRRTLSAFAVGAALTALLWAVPFYHQVRDFPTGTPNFLREAVSQHKEYTLRRVVGLPGEFLLGEIDAERIFRSPSPSDRVLTGILLAAAVFTLVLPFLRLFHRRDLLIWSAWLLGTIGVVAAVDLTHGTTLSGYIRYTILASPAVYAVIASFRWPARPLLRDGVALVVLAWVAITAVQRLHQPAPPKEDWRQLAAALDANASRDDLVVYFNEDPWVAPGTWYMCLRYYLPESNRAWLLLRSRPDAALLRQLQSRDHLWLIGLYPAADGPELLPGWRPAGPELRTTAGAICLMVPSRRGG